MQKLHLSKAPLFTKYVCPIVLFLSLCLFSSFKGYETSSDVSTSFEKLDNGSMNTFADGKLIYTEHCASCHGKKGGLGFGKTPKLKKSEMKLEQVIEQIKKGGDGMESFLEVLSEEEIKVVAAFTLTLRKS